MREVLADCVEAAKSNALEMPADGSWRELSTYASFQEYMAPPATITPRTKLFHLFRPLPQVRTAMRSVSCWGLRDGDALGLSSVWSCTLGQLGASVGLSESSCEKRRRCTER